MNKIWITSDLHFGHAKSFIYEPRGFNTIFEHDETIIKNWNESIDYNDKVYVLGDLMLGNSDYGIHCIRQLKGNINIVRGNHCTNNRLEKYRKCKNIVNIENAIFLNYKKYNLYLSHYPTITSNYDDISPLRRRVLNICGHTHTKDKFVDMDKGLIYHAELDAHDCRPVLLDDILIQVKNYLSK